MLNKDAKTPISAPKHRLHYYKKAVATPSGGFRGTFILTIGTICKGTHQAMPIRPGGELYLVFTRKYLVLHFYSPGKILTNEANK